MLSRVKVWVRSVSKRSGESVFREYFGRGNEGMEEIYFVYCIMFYRFFFVMSRL